MDPIFIVILIVLGILAVLDLIVGVTNDAVNFIGASLGTRIASKRTILIVASVGILVGVVTSNGMMEVARSGVYNPEMFTFTEVMFLLVGAMLADVVLLNTFNLLGLPTSTTVSLIFELLGSAVAVACYKVSQDAGLSIADVGGFINSGKALAMISAILVSVVLSFIVGVTIMYFSRILFSFRYEKRMNRYGALWCGVALVGILYFAIFKGMKSSGLISTETMQILNDNITSILFYCWIGFSVILFLLQRINVNIQKITILSGTFALALAFAGNDLVNFIGVPMAGLDSYNMAMESGDVNMTMEGLAGPAKANPIYLIAAGIMMVLTLFFSRTAMKVAETSINLASQNDEEERFNSTAFSRAMVRFAVNISNLYEKIVPQKLAVVIERQFEPIPEEERDGKAYDNVRAIVNLSAAAMLICIGTSFKLPLSTTYVIFMVAMGSSLADKAWGRESAVYRITGVMVVISGWFMTAISAFVISFVISTLLMWGGWIALLAVILLCGYALCHNIIFKSKKTAEEKKSMISESEAETDVLYFCTKVVGETMERVSYIYNHMLVALFNENRKVLKDAMEQSRVMYNEANERKYEILSTLKKFEDEKIETGHYYVQVVDFLCEVSKALLHCTRPAYEHIDNNHRGFTEEQIMDLKQINDEVDEIFNKINDMLKRKDFSDIDDIMVMRDKLFSTIADKIKNQIRRLKAGGMSTRGSMLYMNILNETKTMVLQSRNLLKSEAYFLNEIKEKKK
ncbi:MAG: inorganic phosphate transporter [Bacteroidales bacterium]|nr:inorganic phosphate transporter [Bacteroidales bacterium]